MSEIQILDDAKYEKAIGILLRVGGMYSTRPFHKLIVGPGQYQALVEAGLVESENGKEARNRGKKKKPV